MQRLFQCSLLQPVIDIVIFNSSLIELTAHLHLAPRLRMNGAIPLLFPICRHGMRRDIFTFFNVLIELTYVTNKLIEICRQQESSIKF